jgi:hypothetical protein
VPPFYAWCRVDWTRYASTRVYWHSPATPSPILSTRSTLRDLREHPRHGSFSRSLLCVCVCVTVPREHEQSVIDALTRADLRSQVLIVSTKKYAASYATLPPHINSRRPPQPAPEVMRSEESSEEEDKELDSMACAEMAAPMQRKNLSLTRTEAPPASDMEALFSVHKFSRVNSRNQAADC